jgi:GPH family glycoside/pentoside/hexuronide:cation symporter/probable glucitol transport protein GutA
VADQEETESIGDRGTPPLSQLAKISYGLGGFGINLPWTFISIYLAIFLTEVSAISAVAVSVIFLVTKVLDVVNDPIIGVIEERTRSKFGRFRPWILYCCPLLVLTNILCFTTPFSGTAAKVIWACTGYLLVAIFYGAVSLGYGALSTVMTYDPAERTELSSWRMIGTSLHIVVLSLVSMPLILHFSGAGDGKTILSKGYTVTAVICAAVTIPMFMFLFFASREVVKPVAEKRASIKETIKTVVTNKPLICIFFMRMLSLTGFFGRLGLNAYYFIYVIGRPDLIGILMMLPNLISMVIMFVFKNIIDKIGKKRSFLISVTGSSIFSFLIFVINPVHNINTLVVLTILYGAFYGLGVPIPLAFASEAIDYMEDKTSVRADGTSYSVVSLSSKIASAIGVSIGLLIMAAFGYSANVPQTESGLLGINIAANFFPAICFLLALIPIALYKLTPEKNAEIRERLQKKAMAKIDKSLETEGKAPLSGLIIRTPP